MKLAILFALTVAVSCNVRHRSDEYACSKNTDCESGRICNDGFCIVTGSIDAAGPSDGPRADGPRGDAPPGCPPGCSSCNFQQKTCTINCMTSNCTNMVGCPAGWNCDILCNTDNSCRNGINCQLAASCSIECTGKQSCQNVQCGSGRCDVACTAMATCKGVDCNNSCACDVSCTGTQSCGDTVQCSSIQCDSGSGCSSQAAFCDTCP